MEPKLLGTAALTGRMMKEFFNLHSAQRMLDNLSDHATMIGPGEGEMFTSREQIINFLGREAKRIDGCEVVKESYQIVSEWGNACLVVGKLVIQNKAGQNQKIDRRVSFFYQLEQGVPKIIHIHISSPVSRVSSYGELTSFALNLFEKADDFSSAVKVLLSTIGKKFNLSRITFFRADEFSCRLWYDYHWEEEGIAPLGVEMETLLPEEYEGLMKMYGEDGVIVHTGKEFPIYAENNIPQKMRSKSTLDVGMVVEGKFIGAICYTDCRKERTWNEKETGLLRELTRIISVHIAKTIELETARKQLEYANNYDQLTGLSNFSKFQRDAETHLHQSHQGQYAMVYIDFANFKYFNERFGYAEGDRVLRQFAHGTEAILSEGELLAHITADQFIALFLAESKTQLINRVNSHNEQFCLKLNSRFDGLNVMLRSGIYFVEEENESCTTAIDRANSARKKISHIVKSTSMVYDKTFAQQISIENEMTNTMEQALKTDQFIVYYQPKVSLEDFSVVGAEALVRWQRPNGTLVPPDDFIPFFEQNGFVVELDLYVYRKVMERMRSWLDQGLPVIPISVNASRLHAKAGGDLNRIKNLVKEYNIPTGLIEFELTETAFIDHSFSVVDMMRELQDAGFKTSIDDFGAGYSVLHVLGDMPADIIKMDKGFLASCEMTKKGIAFLSQIVQMIRNLGYSIICEGVETLEQARFLQEAGCDMAQGYYFARPMSAEQFEQTVFFSQSLLKR